MAALLQMSATLSRDEFGKIKPRNITKGISRAMRRAASTSLRDMRSTASKRIRARKRLKVKDVNQAMIKRKNRGSAVGGMAWGLDFKGRPHSLAKYPHRQLRRGVKVQVNRGKWTLIESAFVLHLDSGHKGIFVRRGARRLPVDERLGSRPVDAMLHDGEAEAVQTRGRRSFVATVERLMAAELAKSV